jgi:SAM-dependent methyltransferase
MTNPLENLPNWAKAPLRPIRDLAVRASHYGFGRWCPVCKKSSRRFKAFGRAVLRQDAMCIHCNSLERHRFVWLYFQKQTDLFDGRDKKVLHVAPEACLEPLLRSRLGGRYLTADMSEPGVDIKMDITDIQYPEHSFDVIYCSHVLEHVPDDAKAMQELHRVLKPEGWAILLVPIVGEEIYEDFSITEPAARLKAFGLEDHVRQYGRRGYVERLQKAGFKVKVVEVRDLFDETQATRIGLRGDVGEIYFCKK